MLRSTGNSRGTGPRTTGLCSLRSPDRKRPRTALRTPLFTVGRGPVPRRALGTREIAGDRPPPYGIQNRLSYRRARACPSPCCDLPETRGGQAPALRSSVVCDRLIANGRATQHAPRYRMARACPSPCLSCLNQDLQDYRICRIFSLAAAKPLFKKMALQVRRTCMSIETRVDLFQGPLGP